MNSKSLSNKAFGSKAKLAMICLIALLGFGLSSVGCRKNASNPSLNFAPVPDGLPQNSYADLVGKVAPAVITIRANKRVRNPQQFDFSNNPFFRDLFGDRGQQQPPQESLERALGSGVIVSTDGYVLTNHHVIDGAQDIKVDLNDGRTFDAKLIGSDPPSDLALLKVNASGLTFMTPGDSDKVRVGDVALAIGNPLGIGQTVTLGIISAKGRSTGGTGSGSFEDFLQTDAPINRGNSGGALINTIGELIGINSQIVPGAGGGNIGIGFAIPSNMARTVMDQLMKTGRVRRGMLGVTIQSVTADLASSLSLPAARGAIITSVQSGGPAERAGLQRGDVITAINKQPVIDNNSLRNLVASLGPGSTVEVTARRNGRDQSFQVPLAELPNKEQPESEEETSSTGPTGTDKYGMALTPFIPGTAQRYGLDADDQGLMVSRVDPDGSAATAGIRQGDLIQEVNRQPVKTVTEFTAAMQRSGAKPALVLVKRRNAVIYLTLKANS